MSRTVRSRKAPTPSTPGCAACGLAAQEVTHCRLPLPGLVVCAAWCADETGGEAGDTAPGDTAPGRAAPAGPAGRAGAVPPGRAHAADKISKNPAHGPPHRP